MGAVPAQMRDHERQAARFASDQRPQARGQAACRSDRRSDGACLSQARLCHRRSSGPVAGYRRRASFMARPPSPRRLHWPRRNDSAAAVARPIRRRWSCAAMVRARCSCNMSCRRSSRRINMFFGWAAVGRIKIVQKPLKRLPQRAIPALAQPERNGGGGAEGAAQRASTRLPCVPRSTGSAVQLSPNAANEPRF